MSGSGSQPPPDRLVDVAIDETGLPAPTPEIEQERRVAIFDLLEENRFAPRPQPGAALPAGPYRLTLRARGREVDLSVAAADGTPAGEIHLSLATFGQVIKDYFAICESYYDAVRRLPPAEIEAMDTARKKIHDEAARMLFERLGEEVETDLVTARRLFTLICVLHAPQ